EDLLGFIPTFILDSDPRSLQEQIEERYAHGGGWRPMDGWTHEWVRRIGQGTVLDICYPGDPWLSPVASTTLRNQRLFVYQHAWVAIATEASSSIEIARLD
ncbi:MAG TPA: hypothetical protein VFT74_07260, partial [Isosphaeraceae bacterium]|nr:hypothetical protein [Isosphaeraceae bacterium]